MAVHYTRACDRCKRAFTDSTMKPMCPQCAEKAPMAQACGGSAAAGTQPKPEPSEEFKRDVENAIVNELVRKIVEVEFAKPEVMARLNAAVMDVVNKPVKPPRPSMQAEQTEGVKPESTHGGSADYWRAIAEARRERAYKLECRIAEFDRACEVRDRTLDDERTSHERTKFELDAWRKDHARREQECETLKRSIATQSEALQAERKDRETLAAALESEREAHAVTRESLKAMSWKEARLEQTINALKKFEATLSAEFNRTKEALSRDSAEHFATRVRLRDVLREAAAYAKEAGEYALNRDEPESEYAKIAREDAAQYEAESAALGVEVSGGTSAPNEVPAAGETAKPARAPFRAGDIVNHRKSGENWVLACDEFDGYVMPAGWPESAELASSCYLVKAATDEERVAMLEQVSKSAGARAARAKEQLEASAQTATPAPAQPDPAAPAFRRRFLAGDRVRPAAQEAVYSAVLDEDDSGNVAIQIGSRRYVNVGADALELVKPADPAKRNLELAFHFHLWHTSVEPNIMDSVPEFVRIAAQLLLRDPWEQVDAGAVPYGQVRVTREESKP